MEALSIIAVSRPWHYWLAVSLLATGVMLVLATAMGYYRKVLVPLYQSRMGELQADLQPSAPRQLPAPAARGSHRLERSSRQRAA